MKKIKLTLDKFERDFTEYVNAGIIYAELQEEYEPLSFEDELLWLKQYWAQVLKNYEI